MSDQSRMFLVAVLTPITWMCIQYFIARPLNKLAHKHLSPKWANRLTRKYFEDS